MKKCIKCKKEIVDDAVYCSFCGKKQSAEKAKYHKREHGTGTIVKDKRYKKQWLAYAPMTNPHQITRKYLGCYATRAEAQAAIIEFMESNSPELFNATLEEIHDRWKETHYPTISQKAVRLYDSMWKKFADIQNKKMRDLRSEDIQNIVNAATSKSAATTIRSIAVMMFEYAMKNDVVSKNYASFVDIPKFESKERRVFCAEDRAKLWEHSDNEKVQAVLILIYTGFRIGEIIALKKSDIHLDEGYMVGGEKTKAGKNRVVPIPPGVPEIKEFIRQRMSKSNGELLFKMTDGNFRNTIFYPALLTAGLAEKDENGVIHSDFTPHSTRHTFASMSAEAGMRPENLQKIIGHSNYSITADVYVHQSTETLIDEMAKLKK